MTDYATWLHNKTDETRTVGLAEKDIVLLDKMFPHEKALTSWALRRGSAAIFADTGLGKTLMELVWAQNIARKGRVLILTPLAVAQQTEREGARFGIECAYRREDQGDAITIANYDILDHFDVSKFAGIVLDESGILKNFSGATRTEIIQTFQNTPYRLACTATPAPNDYTELGNHTEFLGIKTRTEMLSEYFVHDGETTSEWRLKGHAVESFWRWVCQWGAIVRRPSDLGFDDHRFELPALRMHERVLRVDHREAWAGGTLFLNEAMTLGEQRSVRRATIDKRVEAAAELATGDDSVLIWGELNDECDAIENAIPGCVQVKGSDSPEDKVERLLGFADGKYRTLVSKTKIAGHGLNLQRCHRMIFLGASHSFEQTYQAIRRCWRFGQTQPVDVFMIRTETDAQIMLNYKRKEADAQKMADATAPIVREAVRESVGSSMREWNEYNAGQEMIVPTWCSSEVE